MDLSRFRLLLYPFSLIYGCIVTIRNWFFDVGILKSTSYNLPVISVGNLTVGGTGKTPLTELIIRHLEADYRCALLSRGYGRTTRGVIVADDAVDYRNIGDEPMQIKNKFKNLTVVVAEKRCEGMFTLLNQVNSPDVVILDDAFQHRYVKPGLSIVVMDYHRPVWNDLTLPAGNLREPVQGLKRADIFVVNKCPVTLSQQEADYIQRKLKIRENGVLFFSKIEYGEPTPLVAQENSFIEQIKSRNRSLIVMAGIGNPEPFFKMAESFNVPLKRIMFPDHHDFNISDLRAMEALCFDNKDGEPLLLTTEKDAIRLSSSAGISERLLRNVWYIPINLKFMFDAQSRFENRITEYIKQK